MARSEAKVDICNRALHRIGEVKRIQLLETERTPAADVCRAIYDDTVEAVLEDFDWPFARRQAELGLLDITRNGWLFVYSLPDDCVQPRALMPEGYRRSQLTREMRLPFELQASEALDVKVLCTDAESGSDFAVLEYTARIEEVVLFPATFKEALTWRLASDLALSLRKDSRLASSCLEAYERTLGTARGSTHYGEQLDVELAPPHILARG